MPFYTVGQLYHPARTKWPESIDFNYRGGSHEIRFFLHRPSEKEIVAFRKGKAEFGLFVSQPVIFLLYKIAGSMEWSDAPYSWWMVGEEERDMPDPEPPGNLHALVTLYLIDASNGILKAMRALTWSPEFTEAINNAIRDQAVKSFDQDAYLKHLADTYAKYPAVKDMLAVAAARTTGGD